MTRTERTRPLVIYWMYAVALGHLLVGVLLPWIGDVALFDTYHRAVETGFWAEEAPMAARAQQVWWISLFGPTVQSMSLWMAALIYMGDRHRAPFVWGMLIAGVALWAPQDMLVSLRGGAWVHVWIDCFALAIMLPPLVWLWRHDRSNRIAPHS